jgi:type IV pilus biogenesis protein CpaD/CtpE
VNTKGLQMNAPRLRPLAAAIAAALSGCAATQAPQTDARFGDSVRSAIAAQTLNPNAGAKPGGPTATDAQAAVNALKRYRDGFKEPPPSFTILGIGGGVQPSGQ